LEFYRTPGGEPSRIVLRKNAVYAGKAHFAASGLCDFASRDRARGAAFAGHFGTERNDGFFRAFAYDLRATPKTHRFDSARHAAKARSGVWVFSANMPLRAVSSISTRLRAKVGGREVNARINRTYQLARGYVSNLRFDSTQNNSLTAQGCSRKTARFAFAHRRSGANQRFYSFQSLQLRLCRLAEQRTFARPSPGFSVRATR
jgi:hypothetical protein